MTRSGHLVAAVIIVIVLVALASYGLSKGKDVFAKFQYKDYRFDLGIQDPQVHRVGLLDGKSKGEGSNRPEKGKRKK